MHLPSLGWHSPKAPREVRGPTVLTPRPLSRAPQEAAGVAGRPLSSKAPTPICFPQKLRCGGQFQSSLPAPPPDPALPRRRWERGGGERGAATLVNRPQVALRSLPLRLGRSRALWEEPRSPGTRTARPRTLRLVPSNVPTLNPKCQPRLFSFLFKSCALNPRGPESG